MVITKKIKGKPMALLQAEFDLLDLLVFFMIGFLIGASLVSLLLWKHLRSRLNIRIFFEKIVESQYDDNRYRGESPIAGQGEDVPYLG